jgi:hypothetical protein
MTILLLTWLACHKDSPSKPDTDQPDTVATCDTALVEDTGIQIGVITPECRCTESSTSIGTGELEWEDLSDNAPLTMVHGPQGGWHMLGSVRVCGSRNVVTIHYTITHDESGTVISDNLYRVALVTDETSCCGHYPGMYGFISVQDMVDGELDTPPELLACERVTLRMVVTDTGGRDMTVEKTVTAAPDPADTVESCP